VLMNIECDQPTLAELETGFRFNDAILRSLTILQKQAITEVSAIATATAEESKAAESRAKDAAAKEAAALAAANVASDVDLDNVDVEDFDADDVIAD
jgi:small subunit ribosomal protein S6